MAGEKRGVELKGKCFDVGYSRLRSFDQEKNVILLPEDSFLLSFLLAVDSF
jgi:hypothetical protein